MPYITQEQAERAVELLNDLVVNEYNIAVFANGSKVTGKELATPDDWLKKRDELIADIAANKPTNEMEELKTAIKPLYAYIRKHSDKIDTIAVSVDNAAWVTFADTTQRKLLVEPIECAPTNAAETVFGEMRDLNDEEAKKYREMLAKDTVIATAEQIEKAGNPQTNGDHFRLMPDEEIAAMLQNDGCATCPIGGLCGDCELAGMTYNSEEEFDDACRAAIFRWLKMEVECE